MTYEIREYMYGGGYRVLETVKGMNRGYARYVRDEYRNDNPGAVIWDEWVSA